MITDDGGPADLEKLFGDPFDASNPLGFSEILAADERGESSSAAEDALDGWGFNAEFVPRSFGGRLSGLDDLIRRLRPVFRRDAALGLGHGVTSFMGAVNVWAAGSIEQQRAMSRLLLAGGRVAVAYHELAHGNDFLRNEFRARIAGDRVVLNGSKQMINNADRAGGYVVFARTDERPGPRSHSILLLSLVDAQRAGIRYLPRYQTVGARGCHLGGIAFAGGTVAADSVVGEVGSGAETALRSFQVTRATLPAMALGMLDTSLRAVTRFARQRRLYGGTVEDLPHARSILAKVFADLLIADCMTATVVRGLHLAPEQSGPHAAAVKYLVPLLLEESMHDLSVILGARSYLRDGTYAIVGKHLRDLPALGVGHAGGTACLLTIIAQLPTLARRGWRAAGDVPELFDHGGPLPPLDLSRLSIFATGSDMLAGSLLVAADAPASGDPGERAVAELARELCGQLETLAAQCRDLPAAQRGPAASPDTFALAERYALLLAVAACLGVWRHHRDGHGDSYLGASDWIVAALSRLRERLTGTRWPLPTRLNEALFAELGTRLVAGRSFCLDRAPVC